jgi:flagellar FliL protein
MAAAKPDSAAAKNEPKPEAAPAAPVAPVAAPRAGLTAWIPAIATVLLAPVATWATVEFVLLPRLQKKIGTPPTEEHAAAGETSAGEAGGHGKGKGKEGKETGGPSYEFQNVVVNLAGTMGTRYLKTSFLVTGTDPNIKGVFEGAKPKLTDVTLNVLSSLTLADLEEPGAKNVIREKLVGAYNQALGRKVADQVYFSVFVIQ